MCRCQINWVKKPTAIAAAAAVAFVLVAMDSAKAQISVDATMLTSGYTQNFDSMGTSQTAALPTGWKFTAAGQGTNAGWSTGTNVTATTQQASTGSPTSGGIYNWGSNATDRAPGFMTSGSYASPNGILFGLTNSSTSTISGLTLAFDYERYRINSAAANVTFFGSSDGSTWTPVAAGDSGAFTPGTSSYTFTTGTVVNKSAVTISSLNIGQNQSYYLKWNFNTTGSSSQGIGLDNFQAAFTSSGGGGAGPNYYWVGADTTLGGAGTWSQTGGTAWRTTETDGTGEQWDSTKIATFGGTAGTVTVTDTVNANAGLTFSTSGYTVSGGTVSLGGANLAANTINTATGSPTTITSVIAGSTGMTKAGAGILVLDAANTFAGGINVGSGTLEINSDGDLGDVTNDLTINGSLRSTASVALDAGRDLSGSGTLDIAAGTTLTVNGNANFSALTLANSGTLSLQGTTRTAGVLTINSPLRVEAAGAISLSGLTAPALTSGTATVAPAIAFTGTGDRTVNVPGSGALVLEGNVSGLGSGRIAKTGSGTLSVGGSVDAGGFRLGSTGTTPVDGGTLVFGQAASAGTATLQLNYGTLSTTAAGGLTTSVGLSIGGRSGAAAVIGGSEPITFNGQSSFFRGSGTSGELRLNVNNTTTLAGGFAATSGSGTATGITVGGTGTLVLGGGGAALVDTITTADTVRLTLGSTSVLGGGVTVGATNVLNGSGRLAGVIAGAGSVQPGTSSGPGILTAGQLNPAAGTNFVLKFTGAAPNYASATASVNDVLRVTGATPLTAAMTSASDIDLFFGVTTISAGNSFEGGFFTDTAADFASLIAPATVNYYVLGNGAGTDATLAGQGYYSFANWKTSSSADPLLSLNVATTARTANFTGTDVNGQAMVVTAVPEPSATVLGLLAAGLLTTGLVRRRSAGERHPTPTAAG
jgi:autotransporter-associated beta strand protein